MRAKRAKCGGVASEASGVWVFGERSERRGGAAGRPRIVAEGDVLRVENNKKRCNFYFDILDIKVYPFRYISIKIINSLDKSDCK